MINYIVIKVKYLEKNINLCRVEVVDLDSFTEFFFSHKPVYSYEPGEHFTFVSEFLFAPSLIPHKYVPTISTLQQRV